MRKSRVEAAETRERILSTATRMFLDKGLGTVGMRDVMAGANLTPGGFYRHFRSKDRLIAEVSGAALDRAFAMLESETVGKSPARAVERIVSVYLGQSQAKGKPYLCPLAMLGAELRHSDPQVRAIAIDGHQRIVDSSQVISNIGAGAEPLPPQAALSAPRGCCYACRNRSGPGDGKGHTQRCDGPC